MKNLKVNIVGTDQDNLIYQMKRIIADLQTRKQEKQYREDNICNYDFIVTEVGGDNAKEVWEKATINSRIVWLKKKGYSESFSRYKFEQLPVGVVRAIQTVTEI